MILSEMCEIGKRKLMGWQKIRKRQNCEKERVWCQTNLDTKLVCQTGVAKLSFHKEY